MNDDKATHWDSKTSWSSWPKKTWDQCVEDGKQREMQELLEATEESMRTLEVHRTKLKEMQNRHY